MVNALQPRSQSPAAHPQARSIRCCSPGLPGQGGCSPIALAGPRAIAFLIGPYPHETIAVADVESGSITRRIAPAKGTIDSLTASPDGGTIYFAARSTIWAIPAAGGQPRQICAGSSAAMDPKGRYLVVHLWSRLVIGAARYQVSNDPRPQGADAGALFHDTLLLEHSPGSIRLSRRSLRRGPIAAAESGVAVGTRVRRRRHVCRFSENDCALSHLRQARRRWHGSRIPRHRYEAGPRGRDKGFAPLLRRRCRPDELRYVAASPGSQWASFVGQPGPKCRARGTTACLGSRDTKNWRISSC